MARIINGMTTDFHRPKWLNHLVEPTRVGPLENANAFGQAGGGCGDLVQIELLIKDGVVSKAAFRATGCPAAIAGASGCVGLADGKPVLEAAMIGSAQISAHLGGVEQRRLSCLELSAAALASALENYFSAGLGHLSPSERILVSMSGGVDSSTAAHKLLSEGRDVVGLTLRLHDFGAAGAKTCCGARDVEDAREVANILGFPHLVLDLSPEFKKDVIDHFCTLYLKGQTPNPCVECSRKIRFTHLMRRMNLFGARAIATGHYARIERNSAGLFELRKTLDRTKDQSYMFWAADQGILSKLLTPLGELTKDEVRQQASELKLSVADKADSQDVCFVPEGHYADFVSARTGRVPLPGPIEDTCGHRMGRHKGLVYYTVGQRRGLGLSSPKPLYVLGLKQDENILVVGYEEELARDRFKISELNLIYAVEEDGPFEAAVMIRYNSETVPAIVHPTGENNALIELKQAVGPIAPGQSAVFFDGDLVLGGGVIV